MSDLPPPPPPPPGYTTYGQPVPTGHGTLAGFWIRFAATLIDGLILGVPPKKQTWHDKLVTTVVVKG